MIALQVERTDTQLPVGYNGEQPGRSITVRVRNGITADSYLDFADNTFKTSGWTERDRVLADIGDGFYTLSGGLDVAAFEASIPSVHHLFAEFVSGEIVGVYLILLRDLVYTAPIAAVSAGGMAAGGGGGTVPPGVGTPSPRQRAMLRRWLQRQRDEEEALLMLLGVSE